MADEKTFEIGIVMAGAISAGAYTAGVIDFLLEALDAWEAQRVSNPAAAPAHKVSIRVITGASAGGMTAALIGSVIRRQVVPVKSSPANPGADNPFYDAWVSQIDIERLLTTSDLKGGNINSLLNADVLEEIAASVFKGGTPLAQRRSYFADKVDLYLTLTNVDGVPYAIRMVGKDAWHGMTLHKDYIHFEIDGSGPRAAPSDELSAAIWADVRAAALASGAFPIGLAPKQIDRIARDYGQRCAISSDDGTTAYIAPHWKLQDDDTYSIGCVDGGMTDNEPLELARQALLRGTNETRNPREPEKAHRAVLMIDPFPTSVGLSPEDAKKPFVRSLIKLSGNLLSAFKGQARFKLEELQLAMSENVSSRFLISPIRETTKNGKAEVVTEIACSALGGFGGFIARRFRDHDYQLGRRNCQRFLTHHFLLPANNVVMKHWGNADKTPHVMKVYVDANGNVVDDDDAKERTKNGETFQQIDYLPIIPLTPELRVEIPQPKWERIESHVLRDELSDKIKNRLVKIVNQMMADTKINGFKRFSAQALLRLLDDNITNFAIEKALGSLKTNDQLQDAPPPRRTPPVNPFPRRGGVG